MPTNDLVTRRRRRSLPDAAALGLVLILAGCGSFDLGEPEEATLELEGAGPVQVITSTRFIPKDEVGEGDIGVSLMESDTTVVTPPYSRARRLDGDDRRLFVFVSPAPHYTPGDVRLTIRIDGDEWYDVARDVADRPHHFTFFR